MAWKVPLCEVDRPRIVAPPALLRGLRVAARRQALPPHAPTPPSPEIEMMMRSTGTTAGQLKTWLR